ncbi:hypothetical protein HZB58_04420 [Candidatus Gottesmanbacteria bacterium]|nr:hypothetical protein [Candidatus Gottesmanbacteria bacterium]
MAKAVKKKKPIKKPHKVRALASSASKDSWSIKRIYLPLGFAVLALLAGSQLTYTQSYRSDILGDEDDAIEEQQKEAEDQQKEEEERREDEAKRLEDAQKEQEQEQEQEQERSQNSGSSRTRVKTEMETETKSGVKIKSKIEDNGARKIEVEGEGVHFKFEEENGEVKLKVENEEGEESETRSHLSIVDELEDALEDEEIEISSDEGHLELTHNAVRARVNFPLSIDPVTRELIVTTPAGEKTVAILPDAALKNLFIKGFLTEIASGSGSIADASGSASLAGAFELKINNGNLVYEIKGSKKEKFLGLVPVTMPKTMTVSALSGEVLSETQSILSTILGFLSF